MLREGWAVFRLIEGAMHRVSMVGDSEFAVLMLQFDEDILHALDRDGINTEDLYIRPVDLPEGSP